MTVEPSVISTGIWLLTALLTTLAMEGWAALLHGRVWHRSLWKLHRSHHRAHAGAWEANDALSLLHVPIAVVLIVYGLRATPSLTQEITLGVGLGMTCFGGLYLLFHDGLVHGRLPMKWALRFRIPRLWVAAHHLHHTGGRAPYGFFYVPKSVRDRVREAQQIPVRSPRLTLTTTR